MSNPTATVPRRSLLLASLGATLARAARAADPGADPGLAPLYQAAQRSGETNVVVYTAYPNLQPLFDVFSAAFPDIKVQFEVAIGAPLLSRIGAEAASGNRSGDLVLNGAPDMNDLSRQDLLEPELPATAGGLDSQFRGPDDKYQIPFRTLFSLVFNTNRVSDAEVPKTLDEVLADKWKRKFTYAKPSGATAFDICLATLAYNGAISDEQLKALAGNGAPGPSNVAALTTVAEGRFAFGVFMPTQSAKPLQADGAPIRIVLLPDSSVLFGPGLALLRKAPHPNAARLFKAWLFTPQGQQAVARQTFAYGTMPGAPAPEGLPSLARYHYKDIPPGQVGDILTSFRQRSLRFWH